MMSEQINLANLPNRPTCDCGKCGSFQSGKLIFCDDTTDVWECCKCGFRWKAPCNFEEDYS